MTKEEIFSLAEKADLYLASDDSIIKFAKLVAAKEREECAKMCDYVYDNIVTDEHIKAMAFKIRTREQE